MAKQKSSASSATRKKHARKAAAAAGIEPGPPPEVAKKGKGKKDKHAPKVKQYIPPSKPAPLRPDPLDAAGLAARIAPDLLVVLRRLGKKDAVTKRRALDELAAAAQADPAHAVDAAPVWAHHFPALALHAERRVRALTASTHAVLLPALLENVDMAPLLGPWCMLAHDVDRAIAAAARPAWDTHGAPLVARGDYEREAVEEFVARAAIDPASVHAELNPAPPPAAPATAGKKGVATSPPQREKAEADEEASPDRNARLRVGALGALAWLVASDIRPEVLHAPDLWTGLSAERGAFGDAQPAVRRASWALVGSLAARGVRDDELAALSVAALRSAWVEADAGVRLAMWEPLLVFLTKYPQAWHLERDHEDAEHEHSDEDEDEHEEQPTPSGSKRDSRAYAEFLQFLTLGCSGSPARGYPTVLVALSTIPPDIIGDGAAFFTALWGAVDGRALGTPDAARAFLAALVECALFFASRSTLGGDAAKQFARAWDALLGRELKNANVAVFADGLGKLAKMDADEYARAWADVVTSTKTALEAEEGDKAYVVALLKELYSRPELDNLVLELAHAAVGRRDDGTLFGLLNTFSSQLMVDPVFSSTLDTLVSQQETAPQILVAYLTHRSDDALRSQVWHSVLARADSTILSLVLDTLPRSPSLQSLRPQSHELDSFFDTLIVDVLAGNTAVDLAARLLAQPEPFLSPDALSAAEARIATSVAVTADALLRDPHVDLTAARAALALVTASAGRPWSGVRPKAFLIARLVPGALPTDTVIALAEPERDAVLLDLADLLVDTSVLATPAQILDAALRAASDDARRVMNLLFPQPAVLDHMRAEAAGEPFPEGWAVVEPLAVGAASSSSSTVAKRADTHGKTAYERVLGALLPFLSAERALARDNLWVLAHLALLPPAQSDLLAAYLLVPPSDDGWHAAVAEGRANDALGAAVSTVVRACATHREAVGVAWLLRRLLSGAEVADAEAWIKAARGMERSAPLAAHAILRTVSSTSLEPPLLARYRTELAATLAGVPPSKANTEGLRLLRTLNAAAPDVSGDAALVPQQRAVFLAKALEKWLASDDDLDEDVECELAELFVHLAPVLQTVIGKHWEVILDIIENNLENVDLNEDGDLLLLSRTLRLLAAVIELAASTKMLRVEYWASRERAVMGLVLRLLETSSSTESKPRSICKHLLVNLAQHIPSSLLDQHTLAKTVHLLTSPSPSVLQASYGFLQQAAAKRTEFIVIESAASTLTVEATAAEDGEARDPDEPTPPRVELPDELLQLLQIHLEFELDEGDEAVPLLTAWEGMFLAWMLVFDSFKDASAKVKTGFTEQIRGLDLIATYFAPNILGMLGVTLPSGSRKPFKLDCWAVDEFYLALYDPASLLSARLLAAHLYFRALQCVPSLVRAWFVKSSDRQLHNAVSTFTSSYFSPPLIAHLLAPLRSLPADSELREENWAVRTSASEALLAYTVDEQSLEIALRLPADWPLKGAEVREVRRVGGIPENKWRAWVLGAQIVAGGEAGVLGGLLHFRKNVAGHFEGQVECAICYCVISVTDQSLPTKPCRTCKNRFHASCLYKWFKSSHASTCPLCRSDIL
ncbi:hypothetical protein AURDEDRAFT_185239 [Auricularia subglabra TFB-10046 SS5]|nr:hypothetical protein AURDEDRAFT_185239 [Auricularia subglabra TFB-10046 SS5]